MVLDDGVNVPEPPLVERSGRKEGPGGDGGDIDSRKSYHCSDVFWQPT